MGYSTRFQGSGGGPSQMAGYSRPTMAQQGMAQGGAQPQLAGMPGFVRQPQQAQLSMPPRPPMSTYSTPGAMSGMQGQMPQITAQQGMPGVNNANRYANALSRM